jgi:ParB family transcriptional regulator, chromosome partitioning protein
MGFDKGLGRGLDSLIPNKNNVGLGKAVLSLNVEHIIPNPRQPRNYFSETSLSELIDSIQQHGILQPIIVRRRGDVYEIIAGERRWRAAQKSGMKNVPCLVKDASDEESLEAALIENIQRENLNPLDEAEAYDNLLTEFGLTQDLVAQKVGKHRSTVANTLRLLGLPKEVQESIRKGIISAGHARALLALSKPVLILPVWKEILDRKLNVRDTEILVLRKNKNVSRETSKSKDPKKPTTSEIFFEMSEKMTQTLGTKAMIKGKKNRGKIIISYYSQEDLERIAGLILGQ